MNVHLPVDQELETMPGTPSEPHDGQFSLRETLRRHLSSSSLLSSTNLLSPSASFIRSSRERDPPHGLQRSPSPVVSPRVVYAIDPDVSAVGGLDKKKKYKKK
jgi:hypothetical protein